MTAACGSSGTDQPASDTATESAGETTGTTSSDAPDESDTATDLSAPVADIEPVTLVYANPQPEGDPQAFAGTVGPWIELVSETSEGAITIDATHGGSLLTHPDMMEGVGGGLADMGSAQLSVDPAQFPLWALSGIHDPGVGANITAFQQTMITRLMLEEVPALAKEMSAANLTMLFSIASSPHHLLTAFPLEGIDDLAGRQIRTYGQFMPVLFESVGAVPVNMPPDEAVGIGAPIFGPTGVAGSAVVTIPAVRTSPEVETPATHATIRTAREISRAIGSTTIEASKGESDA